MSEEVYSITVKLSGREYDIVEEALEGQLPLPRKRFLGTSMTFSAGQLRILSGALVTLMLRSMTDPAKGQVINSVNTKLADARMKQQRNW